MKARRTSKTLKISRRSTRFLESSSSAVPLSSTCLPRSPLGKLIFGSFSLYCSDASNSSLTLENRAWLLAITLWLYVLRLYVT